MTTNVATGGGIGTGGHVVLSWSERILERLLQHRHLHTGIAVSAGEVEPVEDVGTEVPLGWFVPVAESLGRLPWGQDAWSSEGAHPLNDGAVIRLLWLLQEYLPADGPAPSISPTWDGGVQADWELGDLYLEVEIVPGGVTRCSFVDERGGNACDDQFELSGSEDTLRQYMSSMADYFVTRQAGRS